MSHGESGAASTRSNVRQSPQGKDFPRKGASRPTVPIPVMLSMDVDATHAAAPIPRMSDHVAETCEARRNVQWMLHGISLGMHSPQVTSNIRLMPYAVVGMSCLIVTRVAFKWPAVGDQFAARPTAPADRCRVGRPGPFRSDDEECVLA